MSYEGLTFEVTDQPPVRTGSGRTRSNPFRNPLEESYKSDFAGTNEWYQFQVDVDEDEKAVDRAVNAIRSAGQMNPKIGTEVRADRSNGRIAFRGVPWQPKTSGEVSGNGKHELPEDSTLADY